MVGCEVGAAVATILEAIAVGESVVGTNAEGAAVVEA